MWFRATVTTLFGLSLVTAADAALRGALQHHKDTNHSTVENLYRQLSLEGQQKDGKARLLQEPPACGQVIANLDIAEVETLIEQTLASLGPQGFLLFNNTVKPNIDYGVQIMKVCGACNEFDDLVEEGSVCGTDDYGWNVTHSGLLLIPLSPDGASITEGTHKAHISCHSTRSSTQDVPSNDFGNGIEPHIESVLGVIYTVISGMVGLLPDYMGYGESANEAFRAYIVRKSYGTATAPLLKQAQLIVQAQSNCTAAIADELVVTGYSEGGNAAVALGDSFAAMGKNIISVHSGAGAHRLSTEQLLFTAENANTGRFGGIIPLLASSFSSTYADLPNFNANQDMLDESVRDTVVDVVNSAAAFEQIVNLTDTNDAFGIIDPAIVALFQAALASGDLLPCNNAVAGETDLLCQAFQEQDLVEVLETTTYPVILCHSPDDDLVSYGNLPDLSSNPLLTLINSTGAHLEAFLPCAVVSINFFLNDELDLISVEDKTNEGICEQPTTPPPSTAPSSAPTLNDEGTCASDCTRFWISGSRMHTDFSGECHEICVPFFSNHFVEAGWECGGCPSW